MSHRGVCRPWWILLLGLLVVGPAAVAETPSEVPTWPGYRGSQASGQGSGRPPVDWDLATRRNVRWKTPIPGLGHSSPAVWGDRVFVTSAESGSAQAGELKVGLYGNIDPVVDDSPHRFRLYCLDRTSGRILWERTAHEGVPRVKRHTKSTHANPTPATDGSRVIAFFGSEGLFAYDMEGRLLWKKDLGVLDAGYFQAPEAQWGFASSPVIHDGRVIIQADVHGEQRGFLAAFDVKDGREIWRVGREDVPTWSTPTVHATPSRTQVIVNGWRHIGGYDLATGKPLWRMRGGGDIPVPTPIVAHDLIFITNAHGGPSPVYAVRTDASGDITPAEEATTSAGLAWSVPRNGAYMQTPIVVGDHLFVCRDNGVLTCLEAKTGRQLWQERLGSGSSGFTASAVAADGKIYYTNELGEVFVVRAGPTFEVIATPVLDELTLATPAIVEDMLLFRTRGHVVAIAPGPAPAPAPAPAAPPRPPASE